MAVVYGFQGYICLSTDPKPTSNITPGFKAYETDTRVTYIYDGSAWQIYAAGTGGGGAVPFFV